MPCLFPQLQNRFSQTGSFSSSCLIQISLVLWEKQKRKWGGTDKIEGIRDYEINRVRKILKSLKSTEKRREERRQEKAPCPLRFNLNRKLVLSSAFGFFASVLFKESPHLLHPTLQSQKTSTNNQALTQSVWQLNCLPLHSSVWGGDRNDLTQKLWDLASIIDTLLAT